MIDVRLIDGADAPAWNTAMAGFPEADVYHDHAYATAGGGTTILALARDGDTALAVPLVVRPLPAWLDLPGQDAETPYGFASPLSTGDGASLWPVLGEALAQAGVVNAFLRGHPFLDLPVPTGHRIGGPHATAWIPLDGEPFAGGRCATHRSQVSRARRLGFTVDLQGLDTVAATRFLALYDRTMTRLQALDDYHFPLAYFHHLAGLGDHLRLAEVHAPDGAVVAAALFMRGSAWAHYHLSARTDDCHNAASHLLFEAGAAWAADHGCRGLHLGGGTTTKDGDPLLAFKRRIGHHDATVHNAGMICSQDVHHRACASWAQRHGRPPVWFQGYRQPATVEIPA